jgi:hypothetical protein
MRFIRLLLKIIWNLKTILITGILLVSLALNIVLFLGGSLFSIVNNGFEALTGIQTIAKRNKAEIIDLGADLADTRITNRKLETQTQELSADLLAERKVTRELNGHVAELSGDLVVERNAKRALKSQVSEQAAELAVFRVTNRELKSQVRDLSAGVVLFKGKKVPLKTAVGETADIIGKRSVKTARRGVASMPAEAIPYIGTAVIVGVTALEVYDLCATLNDMSALQRAFDPDFMKSDEELEVCSIEVPPKEEIVAAIKASPQKAWRSTKEAVPTLEEIKDMEMPDIAWTDMWVETSGNITDFSREVMQWWDPQ